MSYTHRAALCLPIAIKRYVSLLRVLKTGEITFYWPLDFPGIPTL